MPTSRQERVLLLAAEGLTDKHIAERMSISRHTVDAHWRALREKFGASTRAEIITRYLRALLEERQRELEAEVEAGKAVHARLQEALAELQVVTDSRTRKLNESLRDGEHVRIEHDRVQRRYDTFTEALRCGDTIAYRMQDGPPYRFVEISDSIRLLGYTPDELLNGSISILDLISDEDVTPLVEQSTEIMSSVKTHEFSLWFLYRAKHKDGSKRWFLDHNRGLQPGPDGARYYTGIAIDVSALVEAGWLVPNERRVFPGNYFADHIT